MKRGFLKSKALFMIVIIVCMSFTISGMKEVFAEDQYGCCQETSGEYCVFTTEDNCDHGFSPTSCEQTSYCKPGCCVSDTGKCSKNAPKETCEQIDGYTWSDASCDDISVCEKDCCVIAEYQCSYTTEDNCEYLIKDLEDIEKDFRAVDSESECVDICTSTDQGCCVTEDMCTYGARGECEYENIDIGTGNGFYKERYCSDLGYCSYCTPEYETRCVGEDVYYFDSCGNQEGIVGGPGGEGDCSYIDGKWCGYNNGGDAYCKPVYCETTFDGKYDINEDGAEVNRNPQDTRAGGLREHGESWCVYESPAGDFRDRPGSQHYRSYCYFGEQIIEPCEDYRAEVCLQYPYYGDKNEETGASCVSNTNVEGSILNENITTVAIGSKFWAEEGEECAVAEIDCPILYAVDNMVDKTWEPGRNLACLGPDWARNMSLYCMAQGDCGASYNLAGEFTDNGFYMTRSQDYLTAGGGNETGSGWREDTYVAYDTCVESGKVDPEVGEVFCEEHNCVGGEGVGCEFIDSVDEIYEYHQDETKGGDLITFGVDGGLMGLSKQYEEMTVGDESFLFPNSIGLPAMMGAIQIVNGVLIASALKEISRVATQTAIEATTKGAAKQAAGMLQKTTVEQLGANSPSAIASYGAIAVQVIVVIWQAANINEEDDPIKALEKSKQYSMGSFISAGISGLLYVAPKLLGTAGTFGPWGLLVAAVIAAVAGFLMSGGKTQEVTISSHCEMWQPPTGSENCELCDIPVSEGGLAIDIEGDILRGYDCTEYKCKSLGWGCEYISENAGTDRPKCIGVETNDVNHPAIVDAYVIDSTPERVGNFAYDDYLIVEDLIDPYTKFEFGIETDEPSQCKIEMGELSETYDAMQQNFPDSYYDYVHNQTWILTPEEKFTFYVRCQDKNGNWNIDAFVVQVETDDGQDITPPSIEGTSIRNGGYIAYGANETDLAISINEPANCKWDYNDVDYTLMSNFFSCQGQVNGPLSIFDDACETVLNVTGDENRYYFACNDSSGNSNTENYAFTLYGTDPLNIDWSSPNGSLYTTETVLGVGTSGGAVGGVATCSYDSVEFYKTNSSTHEQPLEGLVTGDYAYDIDCVDVAGNMNVTSISFTIAVDEVAPELLSLYLEDNILHFGFDEEVSCEYYYESFEFGSGTTFTDSFSLVETTSTYYVVCQDDYANEVSFVVEV